MHEYPYKTFPTLESVVPPHFMIYKAGKLLDEKHGSMVNFDTALLRNRFQDIPFDVVVTRIIWLYRCWHRLQVPSHYKALLYEQRQDRRNKLDVTPEEKGDSDDDYEPESKPRRGGAGSAGGSRGRDAGSSKGQRDSGIKRQHSPEPDGSHKKARLDRTDPMTLANVEGHCLEYSPGKWVDQWLGGIS